MADFCKACSIVHFRKDTRDLAGLCDPENMVSVICEGCGFIYVDHEGVCLSECECNGEPGHGGKELVDPISCDLLPPGPAQDSYLGLDDKPF